MDYTGCDLDVATCEYFFIIPNKKLDVGDKFICSLVGNEVLYAL